MINIVYPPGRDALTFGCLVCYVFPRFIYHFFLLRNKDVTLTVDANTDKHIGIEELRPKFDSCVICIIDI